jgi:hypothetical protein
VQFTGDADLRVGSLVSAPVTSARINGADEGVSESALESLNVLRTRAPLPGGERRDDVARRSHAQACSSTALVPAPGFDSQAQSSSKRTRPSGSTEMVVEQRPLAVSPLSFSWL